MREDCCKRWGRSMRTDEQQCLSIKTVYLITYRWPQNTRDFGHRVYRQVAVSVTVRVKERIWAHFVERNGWYSVYIDIVNKLNYGLTNLITVLGACVMGIVVHHPHGKISRMLLKRHLKKFLEYRKWKTAPEMRHPLAAGSGASGIQDRCADP